MLFGGYKASKLKAHLKMAVTRFQISANKKTAIMKQQIREIAVLLAEDPPKEEKARIKAEALVRDDNAVEAYEILQLNCDLLSERMNLISQSKECPPDLVECVSTLVWASAVVDIPELGEIRKQFRHKYGKVFDADAMANMGGVINDRVAAKLSVQPPSAFLVQTYLEKIADQHGVKWKPTMPLKAGEISNPMPAPSGDTVQVGGGSGLNPHFKGSGLKPGPPLDPNGNNDRPSAPPMSPSFRDIPEAPRVPGSVASSSTISTRGTSSYSPLLPPPATTKNVPATMDDIEEVEIHVPGVPKSPPGAVWYNKKNDDDDDDGSGYGGERAGSRASGRSAGRASGGSAPLADGGRGGEESYDDLAARFAALQK